MSKKSGGRGGIIVNTASAAGIVFGNGDRQLAEANSYFVAKHGVLALTKALANPEIHAETGVTVQCICPSFADTNIIREGLGSQEDVKATRAKLEANFGIMTPEYVAEAFYSLIVSCGNGAAIVVARPDLPPFTYPDLSWPILTILGLGAKIFGLRVFQWQHQIVFAILLVLFFHLILGFILGLIF